MAGDGRGPDRGNGRGPDPGNGQDPDRSGAARPDDATLRAVYERAVPDGAEPLYCVLAGSHRHGTAGPDSDVDLRGVHVADAGRYALLDRPEPRVAVNQDGVTDGFADVPDVEVVTRELRRFGALVAEGNVGALETLFHPDPLVSARPAAMADLRERVAPHLPLDVPRAYVGMAQSSYEEARAGDAPGTAKAYLHALRALLAARHLLATGELAPAAFAHADRWLADPVVVEDLVAVKRSAPGARPDARLAARAEREIEALLSSLDPPEAADATALRRDVDDWLHDVRDY